MMNAKQKQEILTLADVKILVDAFYHKVNANKLLSPIFNDRLQGDWTQHLEKMYRFWQTVLLEEHTYSGSPFLPHATLAIDKDHFNEWLMLFNDTVNELFEGDKAAEAKW